MIIGITGRGGSGKTTLAKKIVENHKNFYYIEVDKLIEDKMANNKELLERVNETLGKKYNKKYIFDDFKKSYFNQDEESRKLHNFFIKELNDLINKEVKNNKDKNIVIEYFLLDRFDVYKTSDIKIKLYADLEERVKRVQKRGNMTHELFVEVDKHCVENENTKEDFSFNITDYQKELVSIIVPVYNGELFIDQTLDAILNQTYKNIEVIVINDGSTDNTLNILNEYMKKDNRIKVINTPNMNVSNARNTGLKHAKGDYISFVDSDDIIDNNFIAALYDSLKISGADYAHSSISVERIGIPHMVTHNQNQLKIYDNPINSFLKRDTTFAVWGKLFKKELIKDINFENITCFEDFMYMWEVSKKANSCVVNNDTRYHYIERNNNSLTGGLYNKNNKELIKHAFKVLKEANYSEDAKRYFYGCLLHNIMLYKESINNPNFKDVYQEEIFLCIKYLELYKDYEFQLIEYNLVDTKKIIDELKEKVGIKCIAILWNSMEEFKEEAMNDISLYGIVEKYVDFDFTSDEFENFLEKIYPHFNDEHWKTEYKINSMVDKYSNNKIRVVYLYLNKEEKVYDDRKKTYICPSVINLKNYMREKYSKKINNYMFDNVFHMTDDEYEYYITDAFVSEIANNLKRQKGYIILDQHNLEPFYGGGKRNKFLYDNFMFKEVRQNSLEDYAELFNEEVCKLLKIKCAFYDLAKLGANKGVITNLFATKENYISGANVIQSVCQASDINEIMQYNNIDNLSKILETYMLNKNVSLETYPNILSELKKIFILDLVLLQSDRNPFNWGLIRKQNQITLAPAFDNSNCANFNHLERDPKDISILLKYNNIDDNNVYEIIKSYPKFREEILTIMDAILKNYDYIFKRIEIKISAPVPIEIKKLFYETYVSHFNLIKESYEKVDIANVILKRTLN